MDRFDEHEECGGRPRLKKSDCNSVLNEFNIVKNKTILSMKQFIKKHVSDAIWFALGTFAGFLVTVYFNNLASQDRRNLLLDNAIVEIKTIIEHPHYDEYRNTANSKDAGHPFPYLINFSIQELYKNINSFTTDDSALNSKFVEQILDCAFFIEEFNDNIRLRNSYILVDLKNVKAFNEGALRYFNNLIVPKLKDFRQFMIENREALIE